MTKKYNNLSWTVLFLLSLFIGGTGADRFYVGKIGTGLLKLFTLGGFGVWTIIDFILVITNRLKDKQGRVPRK